MNARLQSIARRCLPRAWRNALRNPAKTIDRLWKKLSYRAGTTVEVQPREGWLVRCHPMCVEAFTQFKIDPEQRAELEAFVAHCRPGMQLLDLGAHWGFLSLAALHYGGMGARCVAVEPSEAAQTLLKVNLRLNAYVEQAVVLNKAVGQTVGAVEMLTTGAGGNDYFVIPTEHRSDVCVVAQTTIDEICRVPGFHPTHVKIDVEGYEEEVLCGGKDFLTANRPTIFLELHGNLIQARGKRPEAPLRLLEGYGYHRLEQDGQPVTTQQLADRGYVARLVCLADVHTIP